MSSRAFDLCTRRGCRVVLTAAALVLAAAISAGCSLAYDDWPITGLACDEQGACSEGYSCLAQVKQCIPERSLDEGAPCSADIQCPEAMVCREGDRDTGKFCRIPCSEYYTTHECEAASTSSIPKFCKRFVDHDDNSSSYGLCYSSECGVDFDCDRGESCFTLGSGYVAGACLPPCRIKSWEPFRTTCSASTAKICQVLGEAPDLGFACLFGTGDERTCEPCEVVNSNCEIDAGTTCHEGSCVPFCDDENPCTVGSCTMYGDLGLCEDPALCF